VSKLAADLDKLELLKSKSTRRASCFPLYGDGDLDDLAAVSRLRENQVTWEDIQKIIDDLLEIPEERRINTRKFTRHWRAQCSCWESQR
jgi:DNA-binding transcriptional MerR regulator